MKVSINKLMQHPSHVCDELGAIDIYEDSDIRNCIEETMAFIEDESIEGPEDNPFPSSEMTPELKPLLSTLKYAFLDHQHAKPVNIYSQIEKDEEERLLEVHARIRRSTLCQVTWAHKNKKIVTHDKNQRNPISI